MALIEAKQICKNYLLGETVVHALSNVTLTIGQGEFIAISGPSGSGKTTLLNIIGAIDEPTSGQLLIGDHDVSQLSDDRKTELRNSTIGFIFQDFNLLPVLSALENVMLPLKIRGISGSKARKPAMNRLRDVGLADFAAHRPDKMSGGQQQRVAIARALVTGPSLVIADEPTANLDSATARSIIDLMRELNEKEKTTFIFSTHDQRLLNRVKREITLVDGQIGGNSHV